MASADAANRYPGLHDSPACPDCRATLVGTVQLYDRYYLLKCNCGSIFMWPRGRTSRSARAELLCRPLAAT